MKLFFVSLLLLSSACQSLPFSQRGPYPDDWWKPVPKQGAPAWEILPQEAGPGEVILSKRTELGIFSNFAATPFEFRGVRYASVEGFWQMMKYPEGPNDPRARDPRVKWELTRQQVAQMVAFEAKAAGDKANQNMKILGIQWVSFEGKKIDYLENAKGDFYKLIFEAEVSKLRQNPAVQKLLLKTGDLILKPDHHQSPNSPPAWAYYDIWMQLRTALKTSR